MYSALGGQVGDRFTSIYYNVMFALNAKSMMRQGRHCRERAKAISKLTYGGPAWLILTAVGFSCPSLGSWLTSRCRRLVHPQTANGVLLCIFPLLGSLSQGASLILSEHTAFSVWDKCEADVQNTCLQSLIMKRYNFVRTDSNQAARFCAIVSTVSTILLQSSQQDGIRCCHQYKPSACLQPQTQADTLVSNRSKREENPLTLTNPGQTEPTN